MIWNLTLAKFSEHDSSVLDVHGFGFHGGVVSLAYFLHLYFEPTVREEEGNWQTCEDYFLRDPVSEFRVLLIIGEMEKEGVKSIAEGGGD